MSVNRHQAMVDYIGVECEVIAGRVLQFNASQNENDTISFITEYGDKRIRKYLSGELKEYGFAIVITAAYSFDNDDINMLAMTVAQNFADWVEEQNAKRNYPDFGEECEVRRIESLQNMPDLADVDQENLRARYMLHCKVQYYEKRGRF